MKDKIITISISIYLVLFLLLNIFIKDKDISLVERRKLNQFPEINLNFTDRFDDYATDQFVFRNEFRSIETKFNLYILNKKDNNKYVYENKYIYKLDYPTNQKSIDNFITMINKIKNDFSGNVYLSVIPDKSYYLSNDYLKLDYDSIYNSLSNINNIKYIPLNDILNNSDYYKTDTHWKQTSLLKVIKRLSNYMNFNYSENYEVNKYSNFKGVYYGQLGLNIQSDELSYLTNDIINNAYVYDIEHNEDNKVYNTEKLNSIEPYDIYLNGSTPLLTITNNECNNNSELIVFRDSFGSSLAPLLIPSYKKITLVDLRYIDYSLINSYIDISNQDVLFLYSTLTINSSSILKFQN